MRARFNAAAVPENLAIRFLPTPTKDTLTIFGTFRESFDQMVISDDPISVSYPKFVQEEMNKGLAKAIEEVNAKAKELGIK